MRWQQVQGSPAALHAVVLRPDEEVVAEFTGCARAQSPRASRVTAVGASSQATAGWFDRAAKDHRRTTVDEQREALSLLGDIAAEEDGPTPHLHAVRGLADDTTHGGHPPDGRVRPTPEVRDIPQALPQIHRADLGPALSNPPRNSTGERLMTDPEFLAAVREQGGYADNAEAARVSEAVPSTLGDRPQPAVTGHLADQPPLWIGRFVTRVENTGRSWGVFGHTERT